MRSQQPRGLVGVERRNLLAEGSYRRSSNTGIGSINININTRSRLFGYARHLRGRVIQKLGDDSDSLVDCEHHLWELNVALSSVLFKRYEIWSS